MALSGIYRRKSNLSIQTLRCAKTAPEIFFSKKTRQKQHIHIIKPNLNINIPKITKKSLHQTSIHINAKDQKIVNQFLSEHSCDDEGFYDSCPESISLDDFQRISQLEELIIRNNNLKLRAIVQKYKIKLLKNLNFSIPSLKKCEINLKNKSNKISSYFQYFSFYFIAVMGTLFNSISSFLGVQSVLTAIFIGISMPITLIAGLILAIVDGLLFISFEVDILKIAMHIKERDAEQKCFKSDADLISVLLYLKTLLNNDIANDERENLQKICDKEIVKIEKRYPDEFFKNIGIETTRQKIRREITTWLGTITMLASSYYLINSLIAFLTTLFFISTPVSWLIMAFGLLTFFIFYRSLRSKVVSNALSKEKKLFDNMQEQIKVLSLSKDKMKNKIFAKKSSYFLNTYSPLKF